MRSIDETLKEAQKNNRVCPQPLFWDDLYKKLPAGIRGKKPPVPLILAAWWVASDEDKAARLKAHIMWAEEQGTLELIHQYLVQLKEDDWHHGV